MKQPCLQKDNADKGTNLCTFCWSAVKKDVSFNFALRSYTIAYMYYCLHVPLNYVINKKMKGGYFARGNFLIMKINNCMETKKTDQLFLILLSNAFEHLY